MLRAANNKQLDFKLSSINDFLSLLLFSICLSFDSYHRTHPNHIWFGAAASFD